MADYVIAHATRRLAADDPRYPRQTIETMAELPHPKLPKSGTMSYLTPRRIELPGFGGGYVWGHLDMADRFPTERAARAKARTVGRGYLVLDVDAATEWERARHVARVRAKARKIG